MEKKDMLNNTEFEGREIIYENTLPGGGIEYLLKKTQPESLDDMPDVCKHCSGPWPDCWSGCALND